MKKALSIILAILMIVTVIPLSYVSAAAASSPTPYDGVPVTPQQISKSNYKALGLADNNWSQFNGYYAIRDAKELYGFAAYLTTVDSNESANAVLLQDIVINTAGSTTYKWFPLADTMDRYMYTFDGNGHYISGIYCNDTLYSDGYYQYTGFFASLQKATIKNLIIKNSTFSSEARFVGAVAAYNQSSTITNCRVENTVSVSTSSPET